MTLKVDVPDTRLMDRETLEHWVNRLHGMIESHMDHSDGLRVQYKELLAQNALLLAIRAAAETYMCDDPLGSYSALGAALEAYDLTQSE